ncbi:hypothetical protein FQA39_LY05404 [Lamprigera yunnana]|nr:hypothetical protein FQA39_LY05404 [Lamprigera yunnana]
MQNKWKHKLRWKNICDNYVKQKRKRTCGTGTSASVKPPKWPLFLRLQFLEKVHYEKSIFVFFFNMSEYFSQNDGTDDKTSDVGLHHSVENIEDIRSPESTESLHNTTKRLKLSGEGSSPSTTPSSRRSAKNTLLKSMEERPKMRLQLLSEMRQPKEEDEVDLFMRSVALIIKKLPVHLIAQAKLQILTLATNLQGSASTTSSRVSNNFTGAAGLTSLTNPSPHPSASTYIPNNRNYPYFFLQTLNTPHTEVTDSKYINSTMSTYLSN